MLKIFVWAFPCLVLLLSLNVGTVFAQTANWEEASAGLKGAIDLHVHTVPDSGPRSVDALELARIAKRYGMRALLFKNHHTQTASLAYLVNQAVPGIEAYGGIALNNTVGGINPNSVLHMARTTGRFGRVVWMPTRDSEHLSKTRTPNPDAVPISKNGDLLPKVKDVLAVIARENLALATGHSSPEESLLLIREAKAMGVDRIVVTHPLAAGIEMTEAQQVEAASLGAFLEYVYNPLMPSDTGKAKPNGGYPIETIVSFIRAVGVANAVITSDLGQELNPLHTDGMISFILLLKEHGFSQDEIDRMLKINPAKILGLHCANGGLTRRCLRVLTRYPFPECPTSPVGCARANPRYLSAAPEVAREPRPRFPEGGVSAFSPGG